MLAAACACTKFRVSRLNGTRKTKVGTHLHLHQHAGGDPSNSLRSFPPHALLLSIATPPCTPHLRLDPSQQISKALHRKRVISLKTGESRNEDVYFERDGGVEERFWRRCVRRQGRVEVE